jgi:hypothetical protein
MLEYLALFLFLEFPKTIWIIGIKIKEIWQREFKGELEEVSLLFFGGAMTPPNLIPPWTLTSTLMLK